MADVTEVRVPSNTTVVLRSPEPLGLREAQELAYRWHSLTGQYPMVIDRGIEVIPLPDTRRYATRVGRK